jgi:two-component system, chemotaxis family, CheB/CheR fusion protein
MTGKRTGIKQKKPLKETIVVGVGASAGGLEALQDFFKNMSEKTGLAFVVIQHLSPDYKSLMDELLARHTRIPIQIAKDGTKVEPDNIYLIPPRKNISIFHSKLFLEDQDKKKGLNLPIDIFFRSLAIEKGRTAIGIILSGTGSDGTLGIKAIKEAGGMIMVQDEKSAKFDGMPRNVISTGLADFIIPPHKMPITLVEFLSHPFVKKDTDREKTKIESLDTFSKILMVLREYGGIDFSNYKENTILRRLERRVTINRFENYEEYYNFLNESEKEKEILNKELLIGVTRFFRDTEAFDSLKKTVFPEIASRKSIRIWSAGCSTGEEVYSVAILLNEYIEKHKLDCEIKIFATDIDRSSIEYAGKGFYPDSIVADVDPAYLTKYFAKVDNGYLVNESIRKNIVFAAHNILKDSPFSKLDLMICRNLFIYFKQEVQSRILSLIYYSIKPAGFLFMGSSETLGEMVEGYESLDPKWKIYRYKKGFDGHFIKSISSLKPMAIDSPNLVHSRDNHLKGIKNDDLLEGLAASFLPPSVIVDENDNIIRVINDVSPFLKIQPGKFSQNLFSNLAPEISLFVSAALRNIRRKKTEQFADKIYGYGNEKEKVTVVEGRRIEVDKKDFFIISFSFDETSAKDISIEGKPVFANYDDDDKIAEIEKELQFTKESLQATVEELETSNEELQSSNEELIASNEELQSTNEELQSVNEELYTVNSEFQVKIDELTRLNNDINNLLKNTEVGALYLDRNLCIRKITPIVTEITNVLNSDIGRPFSHITITGRSNPLLNEVEKVAETLQPLSSEIVLNDRTYLTRLRPYRTEFNSVEGILITFYDISYVKEIEEDVKHQKELFETILEYSPVAKTLVNSDGKITYINRAAEILFGFKRQVISKRTFDHSKWEITDLKGKKILSKDLPFSIIKENKKPLSNYFHYIKDKDGNKKLLKMSGVPILTKQKGFQGVVFAIEEVKDDKKQ